MGAQPVNRIQFGDLFCRHGRARVTHFSQQQLVGQFLAVFGLIDVAFGHDAFAEFLHGHMAFTSELFFGIGKFFIGNVQSCVAYRLDGSLLQDDFAQGLVQQGFARGKFPMLSGELLRELLCALVDFVVGHWI